MDVDMPVLDGMSATRLIRADKFLGETSQVPIIALTGRTQADDREQCFAAGMNDHVGKPAMLQDLHRALERALGAVLAA
jgi:CheY-like chemotaxis protein